MAFGFEGSGMPNMHDAMLSPNGLIPGPSPPFALQGMGGGDMGGMQIGAFDPAALQMQVRPTEKRRDQERVTEERWGGDGACGVYALFIHACDHPHANPPPHPTYSPQYDGAATERTGAQMQYLAQRRQMAQMQQQQQSMGSGGNINASWAMGEGGAMYTPHSQDALIATPLGSDGGVGDMSHFGDGSTGRGAGGAGAQYGANKRARGGDGGGGGVEYEAGGASRLRARPDWGNAGAEEPNKALGKFGGGVQEGRRGSEWGWEVGMWVGLGRKYVCFHP